MADAKVPRIKRGEAIRAFCRAGFELDREGKKHSIYKKPGHRYHLSIPRHPGKTLGTSLLRSLIEAAGLTVEQFNDLL